MTKHDALKILGLSGLIEAETVKKAFRKACFKFHPDTGGSEEMMKVVNEAYDTLRDIKSETVEDQDFSYSEDLSTALNAIKDLAGLKIEICGSWIWVSGDTMTHKAILKEFKFKWASRKKQWFFRPADFKSKGRGKMSMDEIRVKYGSQGSKNTELRKIG